MNEKYFYKIKDIEDDGYSIYIWTDEPCREIIAWAIEEYHNDNDESESVMFFIDNYLRENGIGYSIIDWNEIEY